MPDSKTPSRRRMLRKQTDDDDLRRNKTARQPYQPALLMVGIFGEYISHLPRSLVAISYFLATLRRTAAFPRHRLSRVPGGTRSHIRRSEHGPDTHRLSPLASLSLSHTRWSTVYSQQNSKQSNTPPKRPTESTAAGHFYQRRDCYDNCDRLQRSCLHFPRV